MWTSGLGRPQKSVCDVILHKNTVKTFYIPCELLGGFQERKPLEHMKVGGINPPRECVEKKTPWCT